MVGDCELVLLREHAHRVANDMAVAGSALRLASRRVGGDPAIEQALTRVEAVSRVQRMLCQRAVATVVDLPASLRELCAAMAGANAGRPALVEVHASPLLVAGAEAWLVSLCVSELVGNALRHGGRTGTRVRVELSDDRMTTTVAIVDHGPPREWSRPGGQGTALVDEIAARLGGAVVRAYSAGGGRVAVAVPSIATGSAPALAREVA